MKNGAPKGLGLRSDQDLLHFAWVAREKIQPRKVKERIRRYKAKMAIKTYYGFDYHLKLCHLIGQVVNFRFDNGTAFNQLNYITNDTWVMNGYSDLLSKNCTQVGFQIDNNLHRTHRRNVNTDHNLKTCLRKQSKVLHNKHKIIQAMPKYIFVVLLEKFYIHRGNRHI